ncbi:MAG: hypothetical protein ACE361_03600 [Aureliella sp.]
MGRKIATLIVYLLVQVVALGLLVFHDQLFDWIGLPRSLHATGVMSLLLFVWACSLTWPVVIFRQPWFQFTVSCLVVLCSMLALGLGLSIAEYQIRDFQSVDWEEVLSESSWFGYTPIVLLAGQLPLAWIGSRSRRAKTPHRVALWVQVVGYLSVFCGIGLVWFVERQSAALGLSNNSIAFAKAVAGVVSVSGLALLGSIALWGPPFWILCMQPVPKKRWRLTAIVLTASLFTLHLCQDLPLLLGDVTGSLTNNFPYRWMPSLDTLTFSAAIALVLYVATLPLLSCLCEESSDDLTASAIADNAHIKSGTRTVYHPLIQLAFCWAPVVVLGSVSLELASRKADLDQAAAERARLYALLEPFGGELSGGADEGWSILIRRGTFETSLQPIVKLQNIVSIDLRGTDWNDQDFAQFADLSSLSSVDLSNTKIAGATVNRLAAEATNLDWEVNLSNTELTTNGLLPLLETLHQRTVIDQVPFFRLSLQGISIDGSTLSEDRHSIAVRVCNLSECSLDDDALAKMISESGNGSLYLRGNRLSGENAWVSKLSGYAYVDLTSNPLVDGLFGEACVGRVLPTLSIDRTGLTDEVFRYLSQVEHIAGLELAGPFNEFALAEARLPGLQRLSVTGKQFTGKCFETWAPDLIDLRVRDTSFDDNALLLLRPMQNLEWLNVEGTKVTEAGLEAADLTGVQVSTDVHHSSWR